MCFETLHGGLNIIVLGWKLKISISQVELDLLTAELGLQTQRKYDLLNEEQPPSRYCLLSAYRSCSTVRGNIPQEESQAQQRATINALYSV